MTFLKRNLILFFVLFSLGLDAHQDDARIIMRRPVTLFDGSELGKTKFLSDYAVRANFGGYFATDEFHSWRFGAGIDQSLLTFSKNALWRFSLNLDTIADSYNSIGFRIAQTQYEVFTALEFKLDESVAYLGFRHRCRHGADKTDSRIIMKTGPEIGFNGLNHMGPFDVLWSSSLLLYVYGQNDDLSHQHRMNLSASVQTELPLSNSLNLFAGAGMSALWVTKSDYRHYTVANPIEASELRLSPGASLGLTYKGNEGEIKTYVAYNSNLDAGFRSKAQQTHMVSINGEVWY